MEACTPAKIPPETKLHGTATKRFRPIVSSQFGASAESPVLNAASWWAEIFGILDDSEGHVLVECRHAFQLDLQREEIDQAYTL